MILTRKQYEAINDELSHYYMYALEHMEKDGERLQENYSLGVYVGMAHILGLLGIKLEKSFGTNQIEISPLSVKFAGEDE